MKRYLLLFSLSTASLLTSSQTEKFDLSKYKLPDIKRQQLDFNFESSGENSSSYFLISEDNYSDTLKHKTNQLTSNYNFVYSYYRNTPKVQSSVYAHSYGNYNKIKQNRTNYYSQDSYLFENRLSFNYDLKYFVSQSNWFVTTVPVYGFSYYNYKDKENDPNYKIKNFYTNASMGLGGGKGRIEQVQDFRHAILLIEELEKRGVSKRNVSETEMTELSSLISILKNKRFFDSRKQKETELVALDSFFVEKGIVVEKSIQYFTGLEDIWSYGGLQVRESGKQVLFSITPGYNFDKNLEDDDNNINENFLMNYTLSFVSKNPISVKWQGDYSVAISHEYLKRLKQINTERSDKSYESFVYVNGKVGYYPNTRTYFDFSGGLSLMNRSSESILDKENYSAGLEIITSAYYYISEKLRVGYTLSYRNSKNGIFNSNIENTYYKAFNYNITLNYAIF